MSKGSLLYLGNKLARSGKGTVTTLDVLSGQLEGEGFVVYSASSKRNKVLRMLHMLWKVFRYRSKVDWVLIDTYSTQNFYYAVAVANVCRLFKVPYIPILHGGNLPERLKKSRSNSYKLFNGAHINVAPSRYLMEAFAAEGYRKLKYIPNTLELIHYPFLLRKNVQPRLLWVRSFAEIYNPLLALEVLKELSVIFPEASLTMIGPDKDGSMKRCMDLAQKNKLPVTFTGKLTKKDWTTRSADHHIFINTTRFDNAPVSVIEIMALGLPIVSTNVGGLPFLLEERKEALLVPSNDVNAFVEAITELVTTPDLAERLARSARKKAEGFDWDIVKQDWVELLKK
ncbi:MAG: glycosyltransferase family 4 protein [Bacteroidota bacterium]